MTHSTSRLEELLRKLNKMRADIETEYDPRWICEKQQEVDAILAEVDIITEALGLTSTSQEDNTPIELSMDCPHTDKVIH